MKNEKMRSLAERIERILSFNKEYANETINEKSPKFLQVAKNEGDKAVIEFITNSLMLNEKDAAEIYHYLESVERICYDEALTATIDKESHKEFLIELDALIEEFEECMSRVRIINDEYVKGKVPSWGMDSENEKNQEFNKRVKAVHNMYEYLDDKGILKKVSFRYEGDAEGASFSFEADKLLPYKEEMLNSGVEDADIAVENIFYTEFSRCLFCGGIRLRWLMQTYRDTDGCVGRSWECWMCQHLESGDAHEVAEKRREKGSKAAIEYMWDKFYLPEK